MFHTKKNLNSLGPKGYINHLIIQNPLKELDRSSGYSDTTKHYI